MRSCRRAMARSSTSTTSSPAERSERTPSFRPARSGRRCGLRADRAGARADLSRLGCRELRPGCVRDDRGVLVLPGDRRPELVAGARLVGGARCPGTVGGADPRVGDVTPAVCIVARASRRDPGRVLPRPRRRQPGMGGAGHPCALPVADQPPRVPRRRQRHPGGQALAHRHCGDRHRGAVGAVQMDPLRSLHRRRRREPDRSGGARVLTRSDRDGELGIGWSAGRSRRSAHRSDPLSQRARTRLHRVARVGRRARRIVPVVLVDAGWGVRHRCRRVDPQPLHREQGSLRPVGR